MSANEIVIVICLLGFLAIPICGVYEWATNRRAYRRLQRKIRGQ